MSVKLSASHEPQHVLRSANKAKMSRKRGIELYKSSHKKVVLYRRCSSKIQYVLQRNQGKVVIRSVFECYIVIVLVHRVLHCHRSVNKAYINVAFQAVSG